jgi:predicted nucleic acid-binding protein
MNAVDTNVLIYAHDSRCPAEQAIATELITTLEDGALHWQVACEYIAASRKLAPLGFELEDAWAELDRLMKSWTVLLPNWTVLSDARALQGRYSLSFWDALLVAACLAADIQVLYTQDFAAYSEIDGMKIVDPFAEA